MIGIWFACAVAAERAAEIITDSKITAPFRNGVGKLAFPVVPYKWRAARVMGWATKWVHNLITCSWCTSAWTSALFSLFLPGSHFSLMDGEIAPAYHYIVKIPFLFGMANFWHAVFRLVERGRVFTVDLRHEFIQSQNNDGDDDGSV